MVFYDNNFDVESNVWPHQSFESYIASNSDTTSSLPSFCGSRISKDLTFSFSVLLYLGCNCGKQRKLSPVLRKTFCTLDGRPL